MIGRLHSLAAVLFALTLFVSAGLLFLLEPMIAKMILPLLGGTPAVWNTCMVFYQAVLLGGYVYAHIASSRLRIGRQIPLQAAILFIALLALPVGISSRWASLGDTHPVVAVLVLLGLSIGFPFFVLSATTPLLQRWFSYTGHPHGRDPYFLYSASNLGSMVALLSYPTIIEPLFTLKEQSLLWTAGYGCLVLLTLCSAFLLWHTSSASCKAGRPSALGEPAGCASDDGSAPVSIADRLRWVALSFAPSSLLLGVTTFLSTDVAAIPLFWVVPLILYLLSFILVFAELPTLIHRTMIRLFPAAVVVLLFINVPVTKPAIWITFLVNLLTFFIVAMVCHGELARSRPSTRHLTEFYLLMSLGGVLGGIFNALLSPLLFNSVWEYPLALVVASLLLPCPDRGEDQRGKKKILPVFVIILALLPGPLTFWLMVEKPLWGLNVLWLSNLSGVEPEAIKNVVSYTAPAVLCYGLVFMKRRYAFGIGVGAVVVALLLSNSWKEDVVYRGRSFFGVIKVMDDSNGEYRYLIHGTTQHGKQSLDPGRRQEPLAYYHREGPIGQVFGEFSGRKKKEHVALIGLGAGTLASYGEPGQHFTFYEIDPAVKRVATDPRLFSYLRDSRATWRIVLGDARLKLEEASGGSYGLIVIDAFSSDAIPVHLLTREALDLYLSKLQKDGVIAMHISNRHLDLEPVVARLAGDRGLAIRVQNDMKESAPGKTRSHWVVFARRETDLGTLARDGRWQKPRDDGRSPVWTDDHSNLLRIFKWG